MFAANRVGKCLAILLLLGGCLFSSESSALWNASATDGTVTGKVTITPASGSTCGWLAYDHIEILYRRVSGSGSWTALQSQAVPWYNYVTTWTDATAASGVKYDYVFEIWDIYGLALRCNGYSDVGWANFAPTATSASLPASTIGGARVCATPSVTDPNTSQGESFTFSVVTQPALGTASVVGTQVCYTPPATGTTTNYSFTYKVTDKGGATLNGTASGTVTNPQPTQATGLVATDGTVTNAVNLSWSAAAGATSYDIYISTAAGALGTLLTNTASTTYSDAKANATQYYYAVVAKNAFGSAPASAQDIGWANVAPTALSVTLNATAGGTSVCVAPAITDANTPQGETFTYAVTTQPSLGAAYISGGNVCYTPPGLITSSAPTFTIKVTDKGGAILNATATVNLAGVPNQVTGVLASDGTSTGAVAVSWSAVSTATGYDVYRSTSAGTQGGAIAAGTTSTNFNDNSAVGNTTYYYSVVAKNAIGAGTASAQDAGWANVAPTATSASIIALVNGPQVCATPSVSDANSTQGENFTFSIVSQPASGTAATVSNQLCYMAPTTGSGGTFSFTYKVTDKGGATFNGTAGVTVSGQVQGVTASRGTVTGKVDVSWAAMAGTASYEVYRSTISGTRGTLLGNATTTSYPDTSAITAAKYYYTVVAKNAAGAGPDSVQALGWANVAPTSTAATLNAVAGANQVCVIPSVTDANGADDTFTFSLISQPATGNAAIVSNQVCYTPPGTGGSFTASLTYQVADKGGATLGGTMSISVTGFPAVVTALTASRGDWTGKVVLGWGQATDATAYDVYRSTSAGTRGTLLATTNGATSLSYNDLGITGITVYYYTVVSKSAAGAGPDSAQAAGFAGATATPAATDGTITGEVDITWPNVVGATAYEVTRQPVVGPSSSSLGTAAGTSFTDTAPSGATRYDYFVIPHNSLGASKVYSGDVGWANVAPTATSASLSSVIGGVQQCVAPSVMDANGTDETFTFSIVTQPTAGMAAIVSNRVCYTPPATGPDISDRFTYRVTDKGGATLDGTADVTAYGAIQGVTATQGTMIGKVRIDWSVPPNGSWTFEVYRSPLSGQLGTLIGSTSAAYLVNVDAAAYETGAKYFYTVVGNSPQGATPDSGQALGWANVLPSSATLDIRTYVGVTSSPVTPTVKDANGADDAFTFSVVSQPGSGKGSVMVVDNQFIYTPPATESAPVADEPFTFRVTDKGGYADFTGGVSATGPPARITNLAATAGTETDKVELTWTAAATATTYQIHRSESSGNRGMLLSTVDSTGYSDTSATTAEHHFYTVVASNGAGPSPDSAATEGWANVAPTSTGASILAAVGGTQQCVTPSVTDDNGADDAFTFSVVSQPPEGLAAVVSNKLCYTPPATGASASFSFTYRVTDKGGFTLDGTATASVVGAVRNVTATRGTVTGKVELAWDTADGATGYEVFRSTMSGSKGSPIGHASTASYTDMAATSATHYFYTVVATTIGESGPDGAQVPGWANVAPVATTASLDAMVDGTQVCMTPSVTDANGLDDAFTFTLLMQPTAGSAVIISNQVCYTPPVTGASATYGFTYRVMDRGGATQDGTASVTVTGAVRNVMATQGTVTGKVELTWDAAAGAVGYDIYRSAVAGNRGSLLGSAVTNSHDDTSAITATKYYYTIVAQSTAGTAADSVQAPGWANVAPTGTIATGSTVAGAALELAPLVTDANGSDDIFSFAIVTQPGLGAASVANGKLRYVPIASGASHTATFTFSATDKGGETISGMATVDVTGKVADVVATQGTATDRIDLAWSVAAGADSYDVYRSTEAGTKGTLLGNTSTAGHSDTTAAGATRYYYTIVAKNAQGSGTDSDQALGWANVAPTATSASIPAVVEGARQCVTPSVSDANGTDDAFTFSIVTQPTLGAASIVGAQICYSPPASGATASDSFSYTVADRGGATLDGTAAISLLGAVQQVAATQGTVTGKVELSWDAATDAMGYDVYRSLVSGARGTLLGNAITDSYSDSTTNGPAQYFYTVVAKNGAGPAPDSGQALGWANVAPTATSAAIDAVVGGSQVCVAPSVTDANGANDDFTFSILTQPASGVAAIVSNSICYTPPGSGASAIHNFTYRVTDKGGATLNGTAKVTLTGEVQGLSATQGTVTDAVDVSWEPASGAAGYDIYRSTTAGTLGDFLTRVSGGASHSYSDASAATAAHYHYTLLAWRGPEAYAPAGTQALGWANKAPIATSADLTTASYQPSERVVPTVEDANGADDAFTFAILTQPARGSASVIANTLLYTPPNDGTFKGDTDFTYKAVDRGGAAVNGTATVHVLCTAPRIEGITPPKNLLTWTASRASVLYEATACNTSPAMSLEIRDESGDVVFSKKDIPAPTSVAPLSLTLSEDIDAFAADGRYTLTATVSSDAGSDTASVTFDVADVDTPDILISPDRGMVTGDAAHVSLKASGTNCPLTGDENKARTDIGKCWDRFAEIPPDMRLDDTGYLPELGGVPTQAGDFPVAAEVFKYTADGVAHKVASRTRTMSVTCAAPSVTLLSMADKALPYDSGNIDAAYTAYACNAPLGGKIEIVDAGGAIHETVPLSGLTAGVNVTLPTHGYQGLPSGNYRARMTVTGSAGDSVREVAFSVVAVPMPQLDSSNWNPLEQDDNTAISILDTEGTSCPLTGDLNTAMDDHSKCYVALKDYPEGLVESLDKNHLPTAAGYPRASGDYPVKAEVYRFGSDSMAHLLGTTSRTMKVRPMPPMAFDLVGETRIPRLLEDVNLTVRQVAGKTCTIHQSAAEAREAAADATSRHCMVETTVPAGLSSVFSPVNNAYFITGRVLDGPPQSVIFRVTRVYPDLTIQVVADAVRDLDILEPPHPAIRLSGGNPIGADRYYVPIGQAAAKATALLPPELGQSMKMTVDDGKGVVVHDNLSNDSIRWFEARELKLFEERQVSLRLMYRKFPQIYTDKALTVVGGVPSTVKVLAIAPERVSDTDKLNVDVTLGSPTSSGLQYDSTTMGQWSVHLALKKDDGSLEPLTEPIDMADGAASFEINPMGQALMRVVAVTELKAEIQGVSQILTSNTRYIQVVKGTKLTGTLSTTNPDGPAPLVSIVTLTMPRDSIMALGGVAWEESIDGGASWTTISGANTIRLVASVAHAGDKNIRAEMVNKHSGVESYTEPLVLKAYTVLKVAISGPQYVTPGTPVTLVASTVKDGEQTDDAVVSWEIETTSGVVHKDGYTADFTEMGNRIVKVKAKARPSDSRPDDDSAWAYATYAVRVAPPNPPRVYAHGLRDLEIGKPYHFEGVANPSWGTQQSTQTVSSEWVLPDGSTIPGTQLDWTPEEADRTTASSLTFRAWVDGYKESTMASATIHYSLWVYQWPEFSFTATQDTDKAPATILLKTAHNLPTMARRFEGLSYRWSFPPSATGGVRATDPSTALLTFQEEGSHTVQVEITDARGNETVLSRTFEILPPPPFAINFKSYPSNPYYRAPLIFTVRPEITGGHPRDAVIQRTWKLDGVARDEMTNKTIAGFSLNEPGTYTIVHEAVSKMGKSVSSELLVNVRPNQPPTCDILDRRYFGLVTLEAQCSDPDGKVVGYRWQINGQWIGATSNKVSYPVTGTGSLAVTVVATDNSGAGVEKARSVTY